MSAAEDNEDEELQAGLAPVLIGDIAAYMWARWCTQPWYGIGFVVVFGISVICDLALPVAASGLVEALARGPVEGQEAVISAYLVFCAIALLLYLCRNSAFRFWIPFAARNMKAIVSVAFKDVQRFSSDWHANTFAGATVRRVSRAMWAYDVISDTVAITLLPAVAVLIGVTVITALQWPLIGLFVGITIAVFIGFSIFVSRYYLAADYTASNAADTRIGASLADAIGANATVRGFGAELREEARFDAVLEDWRVKSERLWHRGTNAWFVYNILLFILQAGLVGLVVREWLRGTATAGDATFAITAFFLVSGYLRSFGENVQTLQKGLADIQDVVAYRSQVPEVRDAPGAPEFRPGAGEVRFENVRFCYSSQPQPLFENFSVVIHPGETVALVGATGSGKSTFVKLLQRLYDPQEGAVLVDGQDVRGVRQAGLRAAMALVPQDPALFHRSLFENIAYARPGASPAEVELAAQRARAHAFVQRLPSGYSTEVGERGVKLSGGERQRVALARAFLADTRILILDEATSSLDTETEQEVQDAMRELKAGRTTIIIAHRLSTVREADRILVFDHGRIVEEGDHLSLVRRQGVYARLNAISALAS